MNLLSIIALLLLAMLGYSIGRNLFTRKYNISPILLDLPIILVIWLGVIFIPLQLKMGWKIALWILIALIIGVLCTRITPKEENKPKYKSITVAPEAQKPNLWEKWKNFSAKMGGFQGRLMLVWFYFIVITPIGVLVRLFSDPLSSKHPELSHWLDRSSVKADLENSRRQF